MPPDSEPAHSADPARDPFAGFDLIHSYSRAQALADGALVDCSTLAREAGIRWPTALTAAAWAEAVAMTPAAERGRCDEVGRLWDVVWLLRLAMGRAPAGATRLAFEALVVRGRIEPEIVRLAAVCGPSDDPSPVITIMLPGED